MLSLVCQFIHYRKYAFFHSSPRAHFFSLLAEKTAGYRLSIPRQINSAATILIHRQRRIFRTRKFTRTYKLCKNFQLFDLYRRMRGMLSNSVQKVLKPSVKSVLKTLK